MLKKYWYRLVITLVMLVEVIMLFFLWPLYSIEIWLSGSSLVVEAIHDFFIKELDKLERFA